MTKKEAVKKLFEVCDEMAEYFQMLEEATGVSHNGYKGYKLHRTKLEEIINE